MVNVALKLMKGSLLFDGNLGRPKLFYIKGME